MSRSVQSKIGWTLKRPRLNSMGAVSARVFACDAAQAREPGLGAELAHGALHRLLLVDPVVLLDPVQALVPELAEPRLLPGRRGIGAEDLQIEVELLGQLVDEMIGLGEEVARIDQDHRDPRQHAVDEVQHDRRLRSEARGQHVRPGQQLERPLDPLLAPKDAQKTGLWPRARRDRAWRDPPQTNGPVSLLNPRLHSSRSDASQDPCIVPWQSVHSFSRKGHERITPGDIAPRSLSE